MKKKKNLMDGGKEADSCMELKPVSECCYNLCDRTL